MRIRTIKPEFFTHEKIQQAEVESGLPLRLAFIGLWCAADREGRFRWEPRRLGVQIMPYDGELDFSAVLSALEAAGFIARYEVEGKSFGLIPSFKAHQVLNNREAASSIPEPREDLTRGARVGHASGTRQCNYPDAGKGEGKGKEGNGERASAPGFAIPPVTLETAKANSGQFGATPEIAELWWLNRDKTGWLYRGQPIIRWQSDLSEYAAHWRSNGNRAGPQKPKGPNHDFL